MPLIKWDDFTGGEYGGLAPPLQKDNQWTGLNMLVYDDGRIGPRGGLYSNMTEASGGIYTVDPEVSSIAHGNFLLIHHKTGVDHKIARVARSGGSETLDTLSGALPGPWRPGVWVVTGTDEAYLAVRESGLYKYVPSTTTITTITTTAFTAGVGDGVAVYRDRMFCPEFETNILRYSVAQDYTDWATAAGDGLDSGSVQVGDDTPIVWLGTVGDSLWIMKQNQEIWVYSGFPERESLRILHPKRGEPVNAVVDSPLQYTVLRSGEVFGADIDHLPYATSITNQGVQDLKFWVGKMRTEFGADFDGTGSTAGSTPTEEFDGVVVTFGDQARTRSYTWIRKNGAWTVHEFDASGLGTTTGGASIYGVTASAAGVLWLPIISDEGSSYKIWPCYTLLSENRPGDGNFTHAWHLQGDDFTDADTSLTQCVDNCYMQTSFYQDPQNRDIRIRRVLVDFLAFDTNSTDTNNFDLTVEVRAADDGEEQTLTMTSWSEANASATADGSPRRHVSTPAGDIQTSMFAVKLDNIRGVAIESIRVEFDIDDTPRR
jgi:hypothetical protein